VYPLDTREGRLKTAQLRIRVEPTLHHAFLQACRAADISAAYVLRAYMRSYIEGHERAKQPDLFLGQHALTDRGSD